MEILHAPSSKAPPDALSSLGARDWAVSLEVSPETALIVTAAILAAVAGPEAKIETLWGEKPLPKLDLVTHNESALQGAVDCLIAPVRQLNTRLRHNMSSFDPEALRMCTSGTIRGKGISPTFIERTLQKHLQALTNQHPGNTFLESDLAYDHVPHRIEGIRKPEFVLENPQAQDLMALASQCHLQSPLVVRLVLGPLRKRAPDARVLSQLISLVNGTSTRITGPSSATKAYMILLVGSDDFDALQASAPDLMAQLISVGPGSVEDKLTNPDSARMFFSSYQRALTTLLELRRQGRGAIFSMQDQQALEKFHKDLTSYRRELQNLPVNPGPVARNLPENLLWALGFLKVAGGMSVSDRALAHAAISSARTLVRSHALRLGRAQDLKTDQAHQILAERIVQRIRSKPRRFRDLVRSFDNQKKDRYSPIVEVLVRLQVLKNDDGILCQGPVELDEVMAELLEKLRA